ncbi:hypothetical protein BDR05DRAFT_952275 [Suillus weaverae]|nr:hypothetical protein BDR05DRAFT_952275 [Suillus weaverae]
MSNSDPKEVPKEKRTKKVVVAMSSSPDTNSETTPTQEAFSIPNPPTTPASAQTSITLPLVTPLPPPSEDGDVPMLSPSTTPSTPANKTPSGARNTKTTQTKPLNALGKIPKKPLKLQGEIRWIPCPTIGRLCVEEHHPSSSGKVGPEAQSKSMGLTVPSQHLLISGLLVEATDLLTTLAVCTTAEVTCFFVPFKQPLPTYICTIKNMTFQDSTRSNLLIAELIRKVLRENMEVSNFIYSHIIAPSASTALRAIDSIRVSSLNITTSRSSMLTVWNIYCDSPPPFSLEDYYLWSALIHGLHFPSDDYGTGAPRLQDKQFTCTGCKSLDHPTGLCPLPATPGWLSPSNTAAKEDLSMTLLDTRPNNSNGQSSKRGFNRGRGTRGHGSSNGPRRGRGGPNFRGFKP